MAYAVGGTVDGCHSRYCFGPGDVRGAPRTHSCACVGFVGNHRFGSHFRTWIQANQSLSHVQLDEFLLETTFLFRKRASAFTYRESGNEGEPKRSSRREDHYFGT
jgi:hypothetical protein